MFDFLRDFAEDVLRDAKLEAKLIPIAKAMVEGEIPIEEASGQIGVIMNQLEDRTDRQSFAQTFGTLKRAYSGSPIAVGRAIHLQNIARELV